MRGETMDISGLLQRDFATLPDLIRMHGIERPEHTALADDHKSLSYGALNSLMDRVAAALQRDGLAPGQHIAVCAANSVDYAVTFLGALRAGNVVVPLAPSATAESIAAMLADADAQLLFADDAAAKLLAPVRDKISAPLIIYGACSDARPFADWLAAEDSRPAPVDIPPEQAFNIIYSSGTTGTPKGIVQSHRMRWGHISRAAAFGYGPDVVTLTATPLYSNTTLVSFLPTIGLGGTAVLMAKFDARKYLELAERHRATHTMLVPVQYQRLMALPEFDQFDLGSFRVKFCTSAPFSAALKAEVLKRWPGGLIEYYGMTEGGGTCILVAHEHPDKLHTVGRPAPGHDIRLIDEDGREVPTGEIGEVVGHSPATMTGYHNQPGKTAEAEWYDAEGRRFIRTGDVGRFDADGFLTLMDRRKDMIISGGFNIYPSDIEAVLRAHPDIADVAVVGVPSDEWGETPVAFVVARPDAGVTAEAVKLWANGQLGKIQRLAAVELTDHLPRSDIGNVLKRELRLRFTGKQAGVPA